MCGPPPDSWMRREALGRGGGPPFGHRVVQGVHMASSSECARCWWECWEADLHRELEGKGRPVLHPNTEPANHTQVKHEHSKHNLTRDHRLRDLVSPDELERRLVGRHGRCTHPA